VIKRIRNKNTAIEIIRAGVQVCTECDSKKSLNDFYPTKKSLVGVGRKCKSCIRSEMAERYALNGKPEVSLEEKVRRNSKKREAYYAELEKSRAKANIAMRKYTASLADTYLKDILKGKGIEPTPDMIALQRASLKLKRMKQALYKMNFA
jgi:predicted GNAT family acetyltransferase